MLVLIPMSYSRYKSAKQFVIALGKAPKQLDNSQEAFNGLVAEFQTIGDPRPGTLAEYHRIYGIDHVLIEFPDGELELQRQENGDWSILRSIIGI